MGLSLGIKTLLNIQADHLAKAHWRHLSNAQYVPHSWYCFWYECWSLALEGMKITQLDITDLYERLIEAPTMDVWSKASGLLVEVLGGLDWKLFGWAYCALPFHCKNKLLSQVLAR